MRRLAAFLAALFWATAACAAIGTPTQLGTASGTTTAVITTGADAPTGSLIVVVVAVGTNDIAVSSVVDSKANCTTYTGLDNTPVASRPTVAVFYCANSGSDLASGQTITVTVPSTDIVSATAFAVSGMASSPADTHAHSSNGASGTSATSVATGTLAQSYELVVGALALNGTASAFTPGNTLTSIGGVSNVDGSAYAAFAVTCSTTTFPFAPSWTTSRAYMSDVVSFKASTAGGPSACASKTNAYTVLKYGQLASAAVSKTNAYVVLQYGTNVSKLNAYFVLQSSGSGSGAHLLPLLGAGS